MVQCKIFVRLTITVLLNDNEDNERIPTRGKIVRREGGREQNYALKYNTRLQFTYRDFIISKKKT